MFTKISKSRSVFILLLVGSIQILPLMADVNATNGFHSLIGTTYGSNAYVENLSTYSAYTYSPIYNLSGYALTFKGNNYLGAGGGGGYMGTQNVSVTNVSMVNFVNNAYLKLGNNISTNSSNITFNSPLRMDSGSRIEIQGRSSLTLKGNITGDPSAEITINGEVAGHGGKVIIEGGSFASSARFNLAGSATTSGEVLDVRKVTGRVDIDAIVALRGNIYANTDFHVRNFEVQTTTASPTTDLDGLADTIFNIDTLSIASGSTSTINGTIKFNSGKEVKINSARIGGYSVLDTSVIDKTIVGNLDSSYATIKAKNLVVDNATFSNNETYLFATATTSNGTMSLNDGAKLYLKSGQSFNANIFNMSNGSILYAQAGTNGGMLGTTEIQNIIFDNSKIYANNLITHNIDVKHNASVFLGTNNSYINDGNLNIFNGSSLQINGGDFVNNGKINISMGEGVSAIDFIKVMNGSFTFDMTLTSENTQLTDSKGITKTQEVQVPKAQINVTISPTGLESGKSYNLLTTANGIFFKDGATIYRSSDTAYDSYKEALEKRINFNYKDGSVIAINYKMSEDHKNISFMYDTGKRYIDISSFIRPGTWVFGAGGSAAFGSIGGIPGASGLVRDYTLKFEPKIFYNSISKNNENAVYYLQNLNYHNYGSTSAKFTIETTGSNFALGKNQDIGGAAGIINIGIYNAKSTLVVKADNIFLGGKINLGDTGLISGHLFLETTGGNGQISGDDVASTINVNNHSSLKAVGASFDYAGTINLNGNKTITDEVGLDLSGISGAIHINTLNASAARPNGADVNAGIKMKNFTITHLNVYKGNNIYSDFTSNIGVSNITNITLESGGSNADRSELRFSGGGEKLFVEKLDIQKWAVLNAEPIAEVSIAQSIDLAYSTATFNNLTLQNGSVMNYGGGTDLAIKGNLVSYGSIFLSPYGSTLKTIKVRGNADFYFNHSQDSVIKVNDIRGLKFNQLYTILKTTMGEITYHYMNEDGIEVDSRFDVDNGNGLYDEFADKIALFSGATKLKNVDKIVNNKEISFKIDMSSLSNPYDPNDIRYWFYRKGGENWIDKINATGSKVMDWFQILMIDKRNGLWANQRILSNDLNYFLRLSKQLESTMGQLSSVYRKNNSTAAVNLATDVNKSSRLVKLSNTRSKNLSFSQILESLQNERFATTKNDVVSLYKNINRDSYKNNIWANGIGAASFVDGGNSTLYGVNVGYDRFVNNVIVGGYLAYAQGKYTGDIIRNDSKNVNIGLYSRAYAGNAEFDLSASETIGFNKEEIYSQNVILSDLNQKYHYNTYTTNINFSYGYLFGIAQKSIILKPQIGASYYYIAATSIAGKVADPRNEDISIKANPDNKQNIALNVAIETRQYLNSSSYWYFIAGINRDLFLKNKDDGVRFVGNDTLSYKKGDNLNTYASLTAGGEVELFKRVFVNLGLGARAGLTYKDININGNFGIRYMF